MKEVADCITLKVNWRDNPFFPKVLDDERQRMLIHDAQGYRHIWEGDFDERYSGAIFANYVAEAKQAGRITKVPYVDGHPVITAWDLGKGHGTMIWFAQVIGLQPRIFDYHEAYGADADLAKLARMLREKNYEYSAHWLPHDSEHERLGMPGSIKSQLSSLGIPSRVVPSLSVKAGIDLARALLKQAFMEETLLGIPSLMHYHFEYDENRKRFRDSPHDDWSTDASDAFRYMAIALRHMPKADNVARSTRKPVMTSTQRIARPEQRRLGRPT